MATRPPPPFLYWGFSNSVFEIFLKFSIPIIRLKGVTFPQLDSLAPRFNAVP
jgi:hypothetical protein